MSLILSPYAVAIRSVSDNEFLRRTLTSIAEQSAKPEAVIIAIPDGTEPWDTGHPLVRFVHAEKGMVTQRAAGVLAADTRQVLLLDDDIVLASDAAEQLLRQMAAYPAACLVPYWPDSWPRRRLVRALLAFWGMSIARPSGGIQYTPGGGYYFPLHEPPASGWETAGGAGAVMLIDRAFAVANGTLGDASLQGVGPYAAHEDGAFIMDIVRHGGRAMMVRGVHFDHLGGTTRLASGRLHMAFKAQFANHFLFWREYVRPLFQESWSGPIASRLGLIHYLCGICFFASLAAARARTLQPIKGIVAGVAFLLSQGNRQMRSPRTGE